MAAETVVFIFTSLSMTPFEYLLTKPREDHDQMKHQNTPLMDNMTERMHNSMFSVIYSFSDSTLLS